MVMAELNDGERVVARQTKAKPEPTERELEILNVLWTRGPSTVTQVHRALGADKVVRTTVLRLMQIMYDKGLVVRDETEYSHVYQAAESRDEVESRLVTRFVDRVFAGSAIHLVARALDARPAGPAEIAEIQRLLAEAAAKPE